MPQPLALCFGPAKQSALPEYKIAKLLRIFLRQLSRVERLRRSPAVSRLQLNFVLLAGSRLDHTTPASSLTRSPRALLQSRSPDGSEIGSAAAPQRCALTIAK